MGMNSNWRVKMKKFSCFTVFLFIFFVLGTSFAFSEDLYQVIEVNADEMEMIFPTNGMFVNTNLEGDNGFGAPPDHQLYYDLTEVTGTPWDSPAIHNYICSGTQWNVYADTSTFANPISVNAIWAFILQGTPYYFSTQEPIQLDPGYIWCISGGMPVSGLTANMFYAAGVEFPPGSGNLYYSWVPYQVSCNCP
jgi:hypothetical protein